MGRQKTAVVEEPPECEVISVQQEALKRLRMAQARLDDDRRKLEDFQRTNFQTSDGWLMIQHRAYAEGVGP